MSNMLMSNGANPDNARRHFLRCGVSLASGLVVPLGLTACEKNESDQHRLALQTFVQPALLQAQNGLLDITLTVSYLDTLLTGSDPQVRYPVSLRAYGYDAQPAGYAGPTLVVRGGDTLRIRLLNQLPENPPFRAFRDPTNYIKPNTTNLHVHGLHVFPGVYDEMSPPEYGDYVVDPNYGGVLPGGGSRQYVYRIPNDHPAGPFYYHPQYHGSSALQVASLMSGALLVRGAVDDLPEMTQAAELVFLFQAPYFSRNTLFGDSLGVAEGHLEKFRQLTQDPTGRGIKGSRDQTGQTEAQPVLINGVRRPTIVMRCGEVQRWRLINTQVFNSVNLSLDGHVLKQFTTDGWGSSAYLEHGDARKADGLGLVLAPGNRASVVLQAGDPGTYYLRSLAIRISEGARTIVLPEDVLAKVIVLEAQQAMTLPRTPLPISRFLDPITDEELANNGGKKRNIIFHMTGNDSLMSAQSSPGPVEQATQLLSSLALQAEKSFQRRKLQIQQQFLSTFGSQTTLYPPPPDLTPAFDIQAANTLNEIAILDSVEEWTVLNMNSLSHVFHIHVNPMYVIKVNGESVTPYWCDTIALPAGGTRQQPSSVTFRMRFKDFTGPYILHNQRLALSDMGMIQRVTVIAAGVS